MLYLCVVKDNNKSTCMRKLMLFLAFTFIYVANNYATERQGKKEVTGVIISSEDGQPLHGVSIAVKGTNIKAITDEDGEFSLEKLPGNAKLLVVKFIGMKPEEVNIKNDMYIVMKSISERVSTVYDADAEEDMALSMNKSGTDIK